MILINWRPTGWSLGLDNFSLQTRVYYQRRNMGSMANTKMIRSNNYNNFKSYWANQLHTEKTTRNKLYWTFQAKIETQKRNLARILRKVKTTFVTDDRSKKGGRLPSCVWDWSKTRKHPARLISQKRIAPSQPPVSRIHSLEVDHCTVITPSATIKWSNGKLESNIYYQQKIAKHIDWQSQTTIFVYKQ